MKIIASLLNIFGMILMLPLSLSFLALFVTLTIGLIKKDYTYFKKNLRVFGISLILALFVLVLDGIFKIIGTGSG